MNKNDFATKLHQLITTDNLNMYKETFNNTPLSDATDDYWCDVLPFYQSLSDKDKDIIFKIIKQISIESVSTLLAILDGVTFLEDQEDDLSLTFDSNPTEKLNGDLLDNFLGCEEKSV